MNRDITLDYLRGFAILSIVIGHLYFFSGRANTSILSSICNAIQIPLFIYVSALLAKNSIIKYSFQDFIKKRVIRLIIPFCSFYIIWQIIYGITIDNTISFFSDEFKRGFWFLLVLFELMLILAVNKFVSQKYNVNRAIIDFSIFVIINAYHFGAKNFDFVNKILSINLLWHYYPIFIIGLYSNNLKTLFNPRFSLVYLLTFCFAFYLMYIKNMHIMLAICNLSSLFFFVTIFNNGYKIMEPFFAKAGQFSLEIYLLHIIVFNVFRNYIPCIENQCLEAICYFITACIICFILIIVSSFLKKSKVINKLLFGA